MDDACPEPREFALIASSGAQRRLLDVQGVDTRLAQLSHAERTLPERAALSDLQHRDALAQERSAVSQRHLVELGKELTQAEADVEQVRRRVIRDQARLDSGQGSHKELEALQHELTSLARRQHTLEDVELDVMERLEVAQKEGQAATEELTAIEQERGRLQTKFDAAMAQLAAERTARLAERAELSADITADLLALYDKIRATQGGGAALLRSRRCEGCRLEVTPHDFQRIRAAQPEDVVRCEECGRILVRTDESGL
ncbi:MAG: zinc ribbon domain-containing protein [Actinomycetota bacterium]